MILMGVLTTLMTWQLIAVWNGSNGAVAFCDLTLFLVLPDVLSENPYDTQVRLEGTQLRLEGNSSIGFLEVFVREVWGPVCNMREHDADSACRQLGYTNAVGYTERND